VDAEQGLEGNGATIGGGVAGDKVSHRKGKILVNVLLDIFDRAQFGRVRAPYPPHPRPAPSPPLETLLPNPCESHICQERLFAILDEHKKASAIMRTMQMTLENDRVRAARHIQHLKVLRKYMLDTGRPTLTEADLDKLLSQAGPDLVLEVPSDSELQVQRPKKKVTSVNPRITDLQLLKKKTPSVNRSVTSSRPSTNRSRNLTPESISSFTESDPDFIPSD
jgi:hypothetical protein